MRKKPKRTTDEDLAQRLATLRKLLGYSQREMAREFNVTPGAIANWESGSRPIRGAVVRLMEIYEENLGMTDRPQQVLEKINATWASRTLRSGMTSAKLLTRLAGGSLQQIIAGNERATQIKEATDQLIAKEVVSSLGEMKGLMTKLGQMMVYMNFALPKNVRTMLEALQDDTTPMSKDAVDRVFLAAFGKRPEQIFAVWEPYPFAAASIGQVHRAYLSDGTKVAVKVQYPEITKALRSDLKNAAVIEKLANAMFRYLDKGAFVAELTERLLEECDYRIEAQNTEAFRKIFAGRPGIVIPKVYHELSHETVLVTEFCEGQRFKEFAATATQEEKNRAGELIFRFTFESIFQHGMFNCDPNGGNFLFHDGNVIFLDFGCVKRFSKDFIDTWKRMAAMGLEQKREELLKLGAQSGFFPRLDLIDHDRQYDLFVALYEPWLEDREYRFTQAYVERTWKASYADNPDRYKLGLPKDWIFTMRLQWGVCALLGELEATANWHRIWIPLTEYEKFKEPQHAL